MHLTRSFLCIRVCVCGRRYNDINPLPFQATFICADCHTARLASVLPAGLQFDLVSCQFALHYSFETEARARMFAQNIAERLKPGGTFVATFPNSDVLQQKLAATIEAQRAQTAAAAANASASAAAAASSSGSVALAAASESQSPRLEFGNSVYKVRFTSPCPLVEHSAADAQANAASTAASSAAAAAAASTALPLPCPPALPASPFGVQYTFDLTDAIAECPEYLVHLPSLCALLAAYDLELVLSSSLHQFFLDHCQHEEYARLLRQMKVLGNEYERPPTADEWEVLSQFISNIVAHVCCDVCVAVRADCTRLNRVSICLLAPDDSFRRVHGRRLPQAPAGRVARLARRPQHGRCAGDGTSASRRAACTASRNAIKCAQRRSCSHEAYTQGYLATLNPRAITPTAFLSSFTCITHTHTQIFFYINFNSLRRCKWMRTARSACSCTCTRTRALLQKCLGVEGTCNVLCMS